MKNHKKNVYFADFETTTASISKERTWIYIWGIKSMESNLVVGLDMKTFFDHIKDNNIEYILFHNLTFDGNFMAHWLLENGYEWVADTDYEELPENKWSWFCNERKSIYLMVINYEGHIVQIECSYKKISAPIAKLGESLSEILNRQFSKGEIDYNLYSGFNSLSEVPPELLEYLERDIDIAMHAYHLYNESIKIKMTAASTAMNDFMEFYGHKRFINDFGGVSWDYKTNTRKVHNVLSNESWDFVFRSYKGGYCNVAPGLRNKTIKNIDGYSMDIVSSYPDKARNYPMPYGAMRHLKPIGPHLTLYEIHIKNFRLKDSELFPIIKDEEADVNQVKSDVDSDVGVEGDKYLSEGANIVRVIWKEELDLWLKYYDMDFKIMQTVYFKKKMVFDKWVKKLEKNKIDARNTVERNSWKLILNSITGKFGQSRLRLSLAIVEDRDNEIKRIRYGNENQYSHVPVVTELDSLSYVPIVSYITSLGRIQLQTAMLENKGKVMYTDTDSMYGTEKLKVPNHLLGTEFGQWGYELRYSQFKALKPKCYIAQATGKFKDGKWHNHNKLVKKISGLDKKGKDKITWDNFYSSSVIKGAKLGGKAIKGGIILERTDITL